MTRLKYAILSLWVVCVALCGVSSASEMTVYVGEIAPFTVVGEDGKVTGAAVDIVLEIMQRAGIIIRRDEIQAISWARAVEEVETKPDTMLFLVARTPQREEKFKWVGPIAELNLGLVAKKFPRIVIADKQDLAGYRLGIIRNSAPAQILETAYGIALDDMTLLPTNELQFRMLEEGRVDLIAQADTAAPDCIAKLGLKQDAYEMVHVMKQLKLYIAFNLATEDRIIERAQVAIDQLKAGTNGGGSRYERIMEKYLKDGPIAMQAP